MVGQYRDENDHRAAADSGTLGGWQPLFELRMSLIALIILAVILAVLAHLVGERLK